MEEERRIESVRLARAEAEIARISQWMRHTFVGLAVLAAIIALAAVGAFFGFLPNPFANSVLPAGEKAVPPTVEMPRELSKSPSRARTTQDRVLTPVPPLPRTRPTPNLPSLEVPAPLATPGTGDATVPNLNATVPNPPEPSLVVITVPSESGPALGARILASPGQQQVTESSLMAAFITTMLQFVKWPSTTFTSPDAPFVIGVLGDDEIGNLLKTSIARHESTGRKMVVKFSNDTGDLLGSQALFIGKSERGRLAEILAEFAGHNVLTFGASDEFVRQGGIVGFKTVGGNVRYELNLSAARRKGLQISAKIVKLADQIFR
jgi:hypothetical protein